MGAFSGLRALVVATLAALLPLTFMAPAQAASKPSISVRQSATSVAPGSTVTFSGSVSKNSAGAKIYVQRKAGSKWVKVGSGRVSRNKKFSLRAIAPAGSHSYRIRVAKTKKIKTANSRTMRVSGQFRASISPIQAGKRFQLQTQMPTRVSRKAYLQKLSGSKWKTIASVTTSSAGVANVSLSVSSKTTIRMHVPARTINRKKYGAWSSPRKTLSPVSDLAQIDQILDEINAVRAAAGKSPLKLNTAMNSVAYNWSKHMHDTGQMVHNPNFSSQIPAGWQRAGENIAAGQVITTVVDAWVNSPGHYQNMIGDYTHIGIGMYFGSNGYKRYYTTNFAKY